MYEELVKELREPCQYENCVLCQKAADAIEELSHDYEKLAEDFNGAVELLHKREKPRWIPVTERLPEPGVPCLCWCKGGTYGQIRWYGLYYLTSHRTWAFDDNDCIDNREVTHWMHRPEPPKEDA